MAFTQSEKEKFLAALMDTRSAAHTGEIRLRFQEKSAEADQLKDACDKLTEEIDSLTGQLMNDWLANAKKAIADLDKKSAVVDDAVADIKKKLKIAQNVAKLIGALDDVVAIAKKALMAL